jgi:hypothetical protein
MIAMLAVKQSLPVVHKLVQVPPVMIVTVILEIPLWPPLYIDFAVKVRIG